MMEHKKHPLTIYPVVGYDQAITVYYAETAEDAHAMFLDAKTEDGWRHKVAHYDPETKRVTISVMRRNSEEIPDPPIMIDHYVGETKALTQLKVESDDGRGIWCMSEPPPDIDSARNALDFYTNNPGLWINVAGAK